MRTGFMSFHAYKEFPDAPYKNASFDTVKKDCDLIIGEIKRFAGDALLWVTTCTGGSECGRCKSHACSG